MIDHARMKELPQLDIVVKHHETDGLIVKEMHIPAGVAVGKEKHDYSHFSFLGKGQVRLIKDDAEEIVGAPACIEVKAGVWHTVIAITDAVWFCTHATDERITGV